MREDSDLGDVLAGFVLLALSGIGGWSLAANRDIVGASYGADPGPGFVPEILLALLAAGALGLIAMGLARRARRRTTAARPGGQPRQWRHYVVPALFVATLAAYAQAMAALGFLETTLAFSVLWTVGLGLQESGRLGARKLAARVLEGAAITAGIYAVFAWLIAVPLP